MRRVLAILAAVGLIAVAVFVRSRINAGNDEEQAAATRPTGTLVCVTELAPVCDQLRAANPTLKTRVEEAGDTYAALVTPNAGRDAKLDAWLAPQPWPTMVEEARRQAGLDPVLAPSSAVLGRSPVVLVIWNDRRRALERSCPQGEVNWTCVGTVAGRPWTEAGGESTWGVVKPGHPPADDNATGLFVFAQATGDDLGRADYARNDLEDPAYRSWASNFEQHIPTFQPSSGTALNQMLAQGRASFDLAGSLEALAGPAVTTSRDKDNLTILYPSPVASADVVLTPLAGSGEATKVKTLLEGPAGAQALATNGWRVDGQPAAAGVRAEPALPANGYGLPRAGVLEAVRQTWKEVS